ncbi:MAG: Coq4 family protein [Myxococcota bacterium]
MGLIDNTRRVRELMAAGMDEHIGDIAILKMDAVSMRARPEHRAALEPMVGRPVDIDLDRLAALPEGTYGRAVADFMRDNDLQPFVFTDEISPEMRRRNAFGIRVAQTHDLIHVLTGFDTSWPGEMGVYAVQYAQRWSAWSPWLALATWLIYPFLTGFQLSRLVRAWRRGVAQGRQAPFLLGERLEHHFDEPLDRLRQRYGLDDPPAASRDAA